MGSHDVSSERPLYRRGCASALTLTFRRVHNRSPSCWHGVTTVVFGNCGVTFAPCWQDDHDFLIELMEGVEVRSTTSSCLRRAPLGLTPPRRTFLAPPSTTASPGRGRPSPSSWTTWTLCLQSWTLPRKSGTERSAPSSWASAPWIRRRRRPTRSWRRWRTSSRRRSRRALRGSPRPSPRSTRTCTATTVRAAATSVSSEA